MTTTASTAAPLTPVYRIDSFLVPLAARDEFLARVTPTHELLRQQDGFVRDFLVERTVDETHCSIITIVEWASADATNGVFPKVQALHRAQNFDPHALMQRLGITANLGLYRPIPA
ncbi:MAG: antibiotic biosynthesis monooxygenase [Candidatus Eremiobacteraeota bacterium]|nr:antibiotic biosynthesis monooxygenase [Candidatus Eremiobacteraeota bacterium]